MPDVIEMINGCHRDDYTESPHQSQMPRIWLQQGAESAEALEACKAKQIPVIHGACVLMYAEPVQSFHSFHKWLWKTFGLLAK